MVKSEIFTFQRIFLAKKYDTSSFRNIIFFLHMSLKNTTLRRTQQRVEEGEKKRRKPRGEPFNETQMTQLQRFINASSIQARRFEIELLTERSPNIQALQEHYSEHRVPTVKKGFF